MSSPPKHHRPFFVLLAAGFVFFTPAISFSQNISISDFRIPESRAGNLFGLLSGQVYSGSALFEEIPLGSVTRRIDGSNANALIRTALSQSWFHFTEDYAHEVRFSGDAFFRFSKANSTTSDSTTSNNKSSSMDQALSITPYWSSAIYLTPDGVFIFGNLKGSGYYNFERSELNDRGVEISSSRRRRSYSADISAGFGYGKVRDGRVVFQVIRVIEKLDEDGLLTRPLGREEILGIVDIFARQREYTTNYERFAKYFFRDLLGELSSLGVIKGGNVDVYSAFRAQEVLSEEIQPRIFGWRIQLGLRHFSFQEHDESPSGTFSTKWRNDYALVSADYGYPLSVYSHTRFSLSSVYPLFGNERNADLQIEGLFIHEVGERIEATLEVSHSISFDNNALFRSFSGGKSRMDKVQANFNFFVEDNVSLIVSTAYEDFTRNYVYPSQNEYRSGSSLIVEFSIRYRFF